MAVPSVMADLSTTANSNSPAGTESPSNADDFLRAIQAIVRTTNAKGSDIASATTTDIGAATGEFVDVTGTTTITGLGTIAAGITRTVRFTGALTLTHNATSLILPGGANITTAANDRAIFRSLGSGNWLCIAYVKADGTATISGLPFSDANAIIKGSSDATKLVRFEADGLTTATTRVLTVQDKNLTIAGLDDIPAAPVRQTVYSGPVDSGGLPNFGGSTGSASVTMSGTLYVTAANATVNLVGSGTNLSWSSLSTNGTMYLYVTVNADGTLTTGSGTLAPAYQWGGTYSTTSGQFTFNIQEMTGKVGDGSAAAQTYRVYVGEVTVAGNVVTAITWYGLMGRYYSTDTGTPSTTRISKNHNLGLVPRIFRVSLVCTSADINYAAGEEVDASSITNATGVRPASISVTRQTIGIVANINAIEILNKTTGAGAAINTANWDTAFYAERGW
jgi:hypothetical protein